MTAKGWKVIITIASQKGGVGKSTIAINLALALADAADSSGVALVDCDEQRSCVDTLAGHEHKKLTVYAAPDKPHKVIEGLKQKTILVDTPPHSHEVMYQAAAVSDLVIIPCQPSPLDIRAMATTAKALLVIREKFNPSLQCRFLVNRITPRTTLANEIHSTLEKLYPFPAFDTMLHDRQAYKQSLISGMSVIEYDPRSPAAKEMGFLLLEVTKAVKGLKRK